jgi:hypothetical protein
MIVRIDWNKPNSDGHKMYHVYQASEYFVEELGYSGSGLGPSGVSSLRLMLDGDKHDICLCHGDTAFVMNDLGKTIDVIRTI